MSDFDYDTTIKIADEVIEACEQAINDVRIQQAANLTDQLGALLTGDTEALAAAGELASQLAEEKKQHIKTMESAQHVKDTIVKNHGQAHEAYNSTGVMAEREFHTGN